MILRLGMSSEKGVQHRHHYSSTSSKTDALKLGLNKEWLTWPLEFLHMAPHGTAWPPELESNKESDTFSLLLALASILLASLLFVAMPGVPSSFLLLVERPGSPSSVLAPNSDGLQPTRSNGLQSKSDGLQPKSEFFTLAIL